MSDYNSSLPVRTESAGDLAIKVVDATITSQQLAITSSGEAKVAFTQALPAGTNNIGKVSIQDSSGTAFSQSNPLPVSMAESFGSVVNAYNTAAALAAGATSNHDYTVTALKTLHFNQVESAASGKLKIEIQIETAVASGVFVTRFVSFNSTANPHISIKLNNHIDVAAGVRVRIIRSNLDKQAMDVYSTICGYEV